MPNSAKNHQQFCDIICFCCLKKGSKLTKINENNVKQIKKHYWIDYNSDNQDYPKKLCNTCRSRLANLDKGLRSEFEFRIKYEDLLTRSSRNKKRCQCFVCEIARSTINPPLPPRINIASDEYAVPNKDEILCKSCFSSIGPGKKHNCNSVTRQQNLTRELLSLPKTSRDRVLTKTLSTIAESDNTKNLSLTTFGPNKLNVRIGSSCTSQGSPYFSHQTLDRLQLKINSSDNMMKEIVRFLRMESKSRKTIESRYAQYLTSKNHSFDSLFKKALIPVQLKESVIGSKKKQIKETIVPGVHVNDIDEFVSSIIAARDVEMDNIDIILGLDSGQSFLKMSCSVITKPEIQNQNQPKRLRFSDGYGSSSAFLNSGVKKTFILGMLPITEEGHFNIRSLIESVGIPSFNFSMSQDIKVILDLLGKQPASCKHPCPYCDANNDFKCDEIVNIYTLNTLNEWHDKFLASGLPKEQAMNFSNVLNRPILVGDGTVPIWQIVNIPELHILLGLTMKLILALENIIEEDGMLIVSRFLMENNIKRICYQGQQRLDGNQCRSFINKAELLADFLKPIKCTEDPKSYIELIIQFRDVVDSCFSKDLKADFKEKIRLFCTKYRELGLKPNVKFHILEIHIVEFLASKQNRFGLGHWTEQDCGFIKFQLTKL